MTFVIRRPPGIMIDGGRSVEGYASDITRTFVQGKPADRMVRLEDTLHTTGNGAELFAPPSESLEQPF